MARNQHHVHPRIALQSLLQEREAIHAWHFHVHDDRAACSRAHALQGFLRIGSAYGGEAGLSEMGGGEFGYVGWVIENAYRQVLPYVFNGWLFCDF
jgi:hypothetical protein